MEKDNITGVRIDNRPVEVPRPASQNSYENISPVSQNQNKETKQPKMTVADLQVVITELSDKIARLTADALMNDKITYKIVIDRHLKNMDVAGHFITDLITKGGFYTEGPKPTETYILYKSKLQMREDVPVYQKDGYPTLYIKRVVPSLMEDCVYLYIRN